MRERDIPLSVVHFDCYWMKPLQWCDFEWDRDAFPDPEGMLRRLGEARVASQRVDQPLPRAAVAALHARPPRPATSCAGPDGTVWQWDMWVAGMGLVDFTNPAAREWFAAKVRGLLESGCRRGQDGLRGAHPDRRRVARRLGPRADAQLLLLPLQQDRLRRGTPGARGGRGGAVRPVGHRRRPAVPGPLGWGLRVDATSRWPSPCAAACRSGSAGSGSGATTSVGSRAHPGPVCSSAGRPSACSRRTRGCTGRSPTGCPGPSTTRRSRSPASSPGSRTS